MQSKEKILFFGIINMAMLVRLVFTQEINFFRFLG